MAELVEYSLGEVAVNNGKDGGPTWIVIRDQVYDVTKFADEHPGGVEVIANVAGMDATKDFDNVGHSADANLLLKKYRIGQLVEEDRKRKRRPTPGPKPEETGNRSFCSVVTCGLCG